MYQYQSKIRLDLVTLNVVNIDLETQYYQKVLGLDVLSQDERGVDLGIKESQVKLIRLEKVKSDDTKTYGLYHLALVLPTRSDLGNFLTHLLENEFPVVGAANHGYSEAIYLEDLEGNGIEIYQDNDEKVWNRQADKIIGMTETLDADSLLADATDSNKNYKLPVLTRMGHIHLSVADVVEESNFYQKLFEMTEKFAINSASWISSGNYHHHFAFNNWTGTKLNNHTTDLPGLLEFLVYVNDKDYFNQIKEQAKQLKGLQTADEEKLIIEDRSGNEIIVKLEEK
ncbi:VOC family protein [Lactococcus lactis]|uniref:VOC family protein n=1 Tax=Lactococcus lactis TaxID=1358 RepID=A0AAW7IZP5_9LACT|nr:VOC family protein [Lactococcus lactis]KWT46681.1 glyoxalase [Lactococcus lactis]MCT0061082.1 VOC family protein [Lactococcus lactis subsp. lactis]MCT0137471.1 VOC family protein [Lactococcus lactis subsp. lactis]MDM7546624.1 VOC family protein [Lactococcus lactis]